MSFQAKVQRRVPLHCRCVSARECEHYVVSPSPSHSGAFIANVPLHFHFVIKKKLLLACDIVGVKNFNITFLPWLFEASECNS